MAKGYSGFLDGPRLSESVSDSRPVLSEEDFQVYARSATPQLLHRAIELALGSTEVKEVLAVAKEVADRGYGRAVQSVVVGGTERDVRVAWRELGNYKPLPLDGVVEEGVIEGVSVEID